MNTILSIAQTALWNITNRLGPKDVLDIIIVAVIIYQVIKLTHKTRGSSVLKGLVLLLVATGVSNLLGLTALNWLLMAVISNGALVLFIVFQPEVRKALESIGRGTLIIRKDKASSDHDRIVSEIVKCAQDLSRRRVGALIVFEQKTGLNDIIETGTPVDSIISSSLLENIFEPNTPLHDGAVIVRDDRIVAAACILTLTDKAVSHDLGTRHRAGIGVSEDTDAVVLIVSEETGIISFVKGGVITRNMNAETLTEELNKLYIDQAPRLTTLLQGFRKEKSDGEAD